MAGHASDPLPLGAAAWWRWGLFCVLLLAFILVPFVLLEGRMNALVQPVPAVAGLEILKRIRARVLALVERAQSSAASRCQALLADIVAGARRELGAEVERLQALAAVNPGVREQEIEAARREAERVCAHLADTRARLDAVRVALVLDGS